MGSAVSASAPVTLYSCSSQLQNCSPLARFTTNRPPLFSMTATDDVSPCGGYQILETVPTSSETCPGSVRARIGAGFLIAHPLIRQGYGRNGSSGLRLLQLCLILVPGFDRDCRQVLLHQRVEEQPHLLDLGDQRDVAINGQPAHDIILVQIALHAAGHDDDCQVEALLVEGFARVWFVWLIGRIE